MEPAIIAAVIAGACAIIAAIIQTVRRSSEKSSGSTHSINQSVTVSPPPEYTGGQKPRQSDQKSPGDVDQTPAPEQSDNQKDLKNKEIRDRSEQPESITLDRVAGANNEYEESAGDELTARFVSDLQIFSKSGDRINFEINNPKDHSE